MENMGAFNNNDPFSKEEFSDKLLDEASSVIQRPRLYEVVLVNDDFTPMEFVISAIKKIFHKSDDEAIQVTMETHNSGEGHCGVYTREVAETKMVNMIDFARENRYPLKCVMYKK